MATRLLALAFTDLVNSTAIKSLLPGQDLGARNQTYLETIQSPHHSRVVAHLAEFEGQIVNNAGDGFFLVFNDLVKAVRWAIDLQQSHQQEPIPTPLGPLEVKIGLHLGAPEPSPNDPGNYLGQEVDFAARLCDLSSGRQIVISESAAALIREEQITGVVVYPHGLRDLRGIGRVPVYELFREGQAPRQLKQAAASPTNLPPPAVSFIGRHDLIEKYPEEGTHIGCWGITEPDHGSDTLDFSSSQKRDRPTCHLAVALPDSWPDHQVHHAGFIFQSHEDRSLRRGGLLPYQHQAGHVDHFLIGSFEQG